MRCELSVCLSYAPTLLYTMVDSWEKYRGRQELRRPGPGLAHSILKYGLSSSAGFLLHTYLAGRGLGDK